MHFWLPLPSDPIKVMNTIGLVSVFIGNKGIGVGYQGNRWVRPHNSVGWLLIAGDQHSQQPSRIFLVRSMRFPMRGCCWIIQRLKRPAVRKETGLDESSDCSYWLAYHEGLLSNLNHSRAAAECTSAQALCHWLMVWIMVLISSN